MVRYLYMIIQGFLEDFFLGAGGVRVMRRIAARAAQAVFLGGGGVWPGPEKGPPGNRLSPAIICVSRN